MTDYGTATSGTEIAFSSCVDERHPPENIIDGTDRSFWVTTGLFPQTVHLPPQAKLFGRNQDAASVLPGAVQVDGRAARAQRARA